MLARPVVVGEARRISRRAAVAEVLARGGVGHRGLVAFEVDVHVEWRPAGPRQCWMGCSTCTVVLPKSTRFPTARRHRAGRPGAARFASTAFWLTEPLSVTSCASIAGGASRTIARRTSVELPGFLAANACEQPPHLLGEALRAATDRERPAERGKISAATKSRSWPGNHHVVDEVAEVREQRHAQRPDPHPRAGRQLEILGQPPFEHEALRRVVRGSTKPSASPEPVEALVVECGARQFVVAPVARRDVGPAQPPLELAVRPAPA